MNAYQQSLKIKRDNYNHDQYILKQGEALGKTKGEAEGLAKGLQKGLEEGEHKKAVEMACQMLADREPVEKIARYTKLSLEEIKAL